MILLSNKYQPDYFILKFNVVALRCDLYLRNIDLINHKGIFNSRLITWTEFEEMNINGDKEELVIRMHNLLNYLKLEREEINNVYAKNADSRYALFETQNKLIEMNKELCGVRDMSDGMINWAAYNNKRPISTFEDHYYASYLRILKDIRRYADLPQQMALFNNPNNI